MQLDLVNSVGSDWRLVVVVVTPAVDGQMWNFRPILMTGIDFRTGLRTVRDLMASLRRQFPDSLLFQRVMPAEEDPEEFVSEVWEMREVRLLRALSEVETW